MEKRYQVFVSSTYADLKDERQRVIQTLMEMDCIPSGMELFPAADEAQWDFIRKVIDDCDYYLLIIGGRYGSVSPDGLSYTEKEFDYAIERGIKVLAFLHESPDEIPFGKSEMDPVLRERLRVFRDRTKTGRLVSFWRAASDLPGLVALSLSKTIKTYPAVGWVRADSVPTQDLLLENRAVQAENAELRAQLARFAALTTPQVRDIAGLDETVTINGDWSRSMKDNHGKHAYYRTEQVTRTITWRDLFAMIAPELLAPPNDTQIRSRLSAFLFPDASSPHIKDHDYNTIKVQLKALNLVTIDYSPTTAGGMALFWNLTPLGNALMLDVRVVRKGS